MRGSRCAGNWDNRHSKRCTQAVKDVGGWDMKFEDLKYDFPKMPEEIRVMIEKEVKKLPIID